MSPTSVSIRLEGELLPAQVEAAVRRRLRILENTVAAVCEWDVAAHAHAAADANGHRAHARVASTIVGGDRFVASASAPDALGALRLAFNEIEAKLHAEKENARERALHWFEKVRSRTSQSWFAAD